MSTARPPEAVAVSLVEDNGRVRETLAELLNQTAGFHCLGAFATGEEALLWMSQCPPEVALVDIQLPGISGIECVAGLKGLMPKLNVLMLTRYEQGDLVFQALRAGATGYLLKGTPPAELLESIRQARAGGAPMSMQVARKVVRYFRRMGEAQSDLEKLSARELEVLQRLSQGYSYKEVAAAAGISLNTVRTHAHAIYAKLQVRSLGGALGTLHRGRSVAPTPGAGQ